MSYYKTCPYCGAHLDSGESCDCIGSLYASLPPEDRRAVDSKITELLNKTKAPASAANAGEGKADTSCKTVSASIISENGGFVK